MTDFDKTITIANIENGIVNVVIEVPYKSIEKIEWNKDKQIMELDRLNPNEFAEPANYGFIPNTIADDGDALDVLVISENSFPTESSFAVKIIGIMYFIDEGDVDDKIISVPIDNQKINDLNDLDKDQLDEFEYYFNHYKDNEKPGGTIVKGWGNAKEAKKNIQKSVDAFAKL